MDDIFTNAEPNEYEFLCPVCNAPTDEDAHFCKFCGQKFQKDIVISEGISRFRQSHNISVSDMSGIIHKSPATIYAWEAGKIYPSMEDLMCIRDHFDCTLSEIVGDIPIRQNNEPRKPVTTDFGYECPNCGEEVFLSVGEALTISLEEYEDIRITSNGNDGRYCTCCGQALIRPVTRNEQKEFQHFSYWFSKAAAKAKARTH
jgi:transcriptional regulator with XRE-family HTH domain